MNAQSALCHRAVLFAALIAAAGAGTPAARAQSVAMHRPVHAGEVTGLELSLEGSQQAPRGGPMHWLVAVHEVVGLSDLRPAPRARVRVLSSLVRDRAVAEVTTDELGRAAVSLDVPADAPARFHVVFEAVSVRHVRRQFDLDVTATPSRRVVLEADRLRVRPGAAVQLWGRVDSAVTGRPVADADVVLAFDDSHGRSALPRVTLHTDRAGGFAHSVQLPAGVIGHYAITATTGGSDFPSNAAISVVSEIPSAPAMIVRAAPGQPLARPTEPVSIEIVVRTGDGRPVRGAVVSSPQIRQPSNATRPLTLRTDARGHASFTFPAPEISAPVQDVAIPINATRTGVGAADYTAHVRVVRTQLFAAVATEGAALIPGVRSRVFVRVVGADGAAAPAGVTVALSGPRLPQGLTAVTDADGAAVFETTVLPPRPAHRAARPRRAGANADSETTDDADEDAEGDDDNADQCGGGTATSFALALSQGTSRGASSGCLAIDPDSTVRVRVPAGPVATAGDTLHVSLERARGVARLPVEIALVRAQTIGANTRLVPMVARTIAGNVDEADLVLPPDAVGRVVIRARPLHGPLAMAIRGGVTSVWVAPGARFTPSARVGANGTAVSVQTDAVPGAAQVRTVGTLVVIPRAEGEALLARIRQRSTALELGDLRVDLGRAGATLISGALANRTAVDDAAPAVLRDGRVVPVPAPEEPASRGTLRDPWRSRARFVEGRLALVFRQIEQHVAASLASGRDNVAQRGARGWDFNREIFDAIVSTGDGPSGSGPRALGGAPLTIDVLRGLDPAFTYDNVARRITRRRMFAILLALRTFVNQHALDLRWSWRGDPSTWLRSLVTEGIESDGSGEALENKDMLDGWGNPFVLRPARGGRARFAFVAPVPGYELVSSGPDERLGTADDVVNPFARVLPSGGAFARAVDEDGLMARLNGVELGRATVSRLATVFEVEADSGSGDGDDSASSATTDWYQVPTRFEADPDVLEAVRPGSWANAHAIPLATLTAGTGATQAADFPIHVDDEPRVYAVVVDAWTEQGYTASASTRFRAGTPVLVRLPLAASGETLRPLIPPVRVDEPIHVDATITNLSDSSRTFQIAARTASPLAAEAPATLRVAAGEAATIELTVRAIAAGRGAVRLIVSDEQGNSLREVTAPLIADHGTLALREDSSALVRAGTRSDLAARTLRGGQITSARVLITAPNALMEDPEFDRVRRLDPALIAWAYTLASRDLPPDLGAALFQAQTPAGSMRLMDMTEHGGQLMGWSAALSTACAVVTWSAAGEEDTRAQTARARATHALAGLLGRLPDAQSAAAGALREQAAVLAAVATGGQSADDGAEASVDPIASMVERLRAGLREAGSTFGAQPTLLARASAGLLLTDPADSRGAQLFETARHAVVQEPSGAAWLHADAARSWREEEIAGTAALAIAAQQRGEVALAAQLAAGLASRAHVAMRLGGEASFWLLAAVSYGVYGLAAPDAATVVTGGGASRRIALPRGLAVLPLTGLGVGATGAQAGITLPGEGTMAFARLEALYETPYAASDSGPLRLALEGDPGFAGEVSALELTVRNTGTAAVSRVVLEILLPAGAGFDEAARVALSRQPKVSSVEIRDGALLRVIYDGIAGAETVALPLAVRWLARGRVTGFAATAYVEDHAAVLTVLPPRALDLRPRPEE